MVSAVAAAEVIAAAAGDPDPLPRAEHVGNRAATVALLTDQVWFLRLVLLNLCNFPVESQHWETSCPRNGAREHGHVCLCIVWFSVVTEMP